MLVHIQIPYESRYLTEGQYENLSKISFLAVDGRKQTESDSGVTDSNNRLGTFYLYSENILVDEEDLPSIDFPYTVIKRQRVKGDLSHFTPRTTTVINQKVNVAVPGIGLLQINEVQVHEDCCTDTLQGRLSDGWRILAICPQPDQRRPDYILGRFSEKESD